MFEERCQGGRALLTREDDTQLQDVALYAEIQSNMERRPWHTFMYNLVVKCFAKVSRSGNIEAK